MSNPNMYIPPDDRRDDLPPDDPPGNENTEDFSIDLSLLDEYPDNPSGTGTGGEDAGTPAPRKKKKKKKRRQGCVSAAVWVAGIIAVSLGVAFGVLTLVADFLGIGGAGTVQIEIERGTPSAEIARRLDKAGVIRYSTAFRLYSKLMGFDGKFQYGVYVFDKEDGYEALCETLQEEGMKADTVKVKIPEGAEIDDIRKLFADAGICTEEQFREASLDLSYYDEFDFIKELPVEQVYYHLEGYMFPDTYEFYRYNSTECARQAIRRTLAQTDAKLRPYRSKIKKSGYTVHEILTMASILELETSNASKTDRENVAAVFYNRLNWKDQPKLLGSSPTAEYPYGNGRYDTNQTEGLPPGPLCAPSEASISAAVNPTDDFKFDYFVTDKNGKFYYNKTLEEHNATVSRLKQEDLWLE